jgi:hypothetical protein
LHPSTSSDGKARGSRIFRARPRSRDEPRGPRIFAKSLPLDGRPACSDAYRRPGRLSFHVCPGAVRFGAVFNLARSPPRRGHATSYSDCSPDRYVALIHSQSGKARGRWHIRRPVRNDGVANDRALAISSSAAEPACHWARHPAKANSAKESVDNTSKIFSFRCRRRPIPRIEASCRMQITCRVFLVPVGRGGSFVAAPPRKARPRRIPRELLLLPASLNRL